MLLHQSAPSEETRPHCSNRDTEDLGGGFVRLILEVDQHQGGVERLRKPRQCILDCRTEIDPRVKLVGPVACRAMECFGQRHAVALRIVDLHGERLPLTGAQKDVSANREEPPAAVTTGQKGVPRSVRPQKGVLHDVVGVRLVPSQREREPVDIIDPGNRFSLERTISRDLFRIRQLNNGLLATR
jgi:hypothetical protein